MADIKLENVEKVYDGGVHAVQDLSLEIKDGEFMVFVGPSGCGKSTVLRMIAGLEALTGGDLYIGGRLVNDVPPKDRDIAMVFQNYALYPHMTAYKNMAFGLENRHVPRAEIDAKVREAAKILGIEDLLKRKPKAMSGGQRQRVALGRAIVREPAVFLLDEPLSNLDAKLRTSMRTEIIKLHKRLGTTFVYVTHDQTEAMTMGDRIVVLKEGVVQQTDTPRNIYDYPCNRFVAGFIGTPQMNFIDAVAEKNGDGWRLRFESGAVAIGRRDTLFPYEGKTVCVGVRPEDASIADAGLPARVEVVEALGSETYVYLRCCGAHVAVRNGRAADVQMDDDVFLSLDPAKLHLFDPETEKRI